MWGEISALRLPEGAERAIRAIFWGKIIIAPLDSRADSTVYG